MLSARRTARLLPAAALLLLACVGPQMAWAHALLLRQDPPPDVVMPHQPALIHLWFSENLNGSASKIVVWDRYRHVFNRGDATLVPGQPRQLEVHLGPMHPGAYLVLWTSVSAEDGHVLRGSYLFYVQSKGPGPSLAGVPGGGLQQTFPDALGLMSILAHWLELLAAVTWVGAAFFSRFVLAGTDILLHREVIDAERWRLGRLTVTALVVLFLSSGVVLLTQVFALGGNSWSGLFSGSIWSQEFSAEYGQIWFGRAELVLIALLICAPLAQGRVSRDALEIELPAGAVRGEGSPTWMLPFLGMLYLYAFAASGHAASAEVGTLNGSHILSGAVFVDWLHFIADALWLGGQIYIVLVLAQALQIRRELGPHAGAFLRVLNRFSPAAYLSVGLFFLSGLFSAKIHIPSWYAFFHSVYGWTLVIKMGLIAGMMAVSTVTVYMLRPRIRRSMAAAHSSVPFASVILMDTLARWLRAGPVLGAGVLLATSVMFYYPVPAGLSPPGPSFYSLHGSGLTAVLTIRPDRSGPNVITVRLRDSRGRPVQQATLRVLTDMLDMVMGQGIGVLNETSPGTYRGTTDLGMGGRWRLVLLVYQPNGFTRMTVDVVVGT